MIWRWFFSQTARNTLDLASRVRKILSAQWDQISAAGREQVLAAIQSLREAVASGADATVLAEQATQLETAANKWLKPYPHANIRENVDVVLVAMVVALAVRTFFLQPMAIPTGSMQPTLYGITPGPSKPSYEPNLVVPNFAVRWFDSWVRGVSYYQVRARSDGAFVRFFPEETVFPLVKRVRFQAGNETYTVWFPPEEFAKRVALEPGRVYRKGEPIISVRVASGDRLFVDRLTYNFRRPERGEIVIFASTGIPGLAEGTHYIKRLVGLGGENLRIGNDRRAVINGVSLDASTPRFENLYTFNGPPKEDHYSGHVNGKVARENGFAMMLTGRFQDERDEFAIPQNHLFVMGDNTMNSYDSRYWGSFPRQKVVGKCWFVFWPITDRFGWGVR